jgi:hypothetical protein
MRLERCDKNGRKRKKVKEGETKLEKTYFWRPIENQ